jgi:hypothetical protein
MYNVALPYPVDRFISPLFSGSMPPNLNYRIYNIPVQLVQFAPSIAYMLAYMISQSANQSPLRIYFFNKYSRNNWENEDFRSLIEAASNLILQMNVNVADQNQLTAACDEVIKYYAAYEFGINYSVFSQLIDANTQQILMNYIQAKGIRIPGMAMPQPGYGVPMGMPTIGAPTIGAPMPSYAPAIGNRSTGHSTLDEERYGSNIQQPQQNLGVVNMDRNAHSAGVSVQDLQTPLNNARTVTNYEVPETRIETTPLRHYGITFESKDEIFDSMSDLSNKVFFDHEDFFRDNTYDLKYVIVNNFDYVIGTAPFTKEVKSLNLVENFISFIDGKISKDQMNDILNKIPGRVKKIFIMFLEEIKLLTNNLISTNKCRTTLYKEENKTFIDDYNDLLLNLISKGRNDIVSDLKIALHTWVVNNNLFSIREYEDNKGKISNMAVVKLNVIIVNVSSKVFSGYRLSDLDFLCELRVMTLYVITSNNVLFKIEFGSEYTGDKTKYFVPIDILKIGTLL